MHFRELVQRFETHMAAAEPGRGDTAFKWIDENRVSGLCPLHDNHQNAEKRAFYLTYDADTKATLVACHQCGTDRASTQRIIEAIGLRWGDLFADGASRHARSLTDPERKKLSDVQVVQFRSLLGNDELLKHLHQTRGISTQAIKDSMMGVCEKGGAYYATMLCTDSAGKIAGVKCHLIKRGGSSNGVTKSFWVPGDRKCNTQSLWPVMINSGAKTAADACRFLWLTGGGLKALSLASLGLNAVGHAEGEGANRIPYRVLEIARKHNLIIAIPADGDPMGMKSAAHWKEYLRNFGCGACVVRLWGRGQDVDGWIASKLHDDCLKPEQIVAELTQAAAQADDEDDDIVRSAVLFDRKRIDRTVEEICHRVIGDDPELFVRHGQLVRLRGDSVLEPPGPMTVMCRIAKTASLYSMDPKGGVVPQAPTPELARAVLEFGDYPSALPVDGLVVGPIIQPDGEIRYERGYDPITRHIYGTPPIPVDENGKEIGPIEYPMVPEEPTKAEAVEALRSVKDLVRESLFEDERSRSAWVALVLTTVCRPIVGVSTPLFVLDGNDSGCGKTSHAQAAAMIGFGVLGDTPGYVENEEERRKFLVSMFLSGSQFCTLDNCKTKLGGAVIEALLTSDGGVPHRKLRTESMIRVPRTTVLAATMNQAQITHDMARRVVLIRFKKLREPQYSIVDFKKHIERNRGWLYTAALTVVSAYLKSGDQVELSAPMAGFEKWSVVRRALVWAGEADPVLGRDDIEEEIGGELDDLIALVVAWGDAYGIVTPDLTPKEAETIARAAPEVLSDVTSATSVLPGSEREALRQALHGLCDEADLTSRRIGKRLAGIADRPAMIDGQVFTIRPVGKRFRNLRRWAVWTDAPKAVGIDDLDGRDGAVEVQI